MIDSATQLVYGFPKDSSAVNDPDHRPRYFQHQSKSVRTTYQTFVDRNKTRSGGKYIARRDFGYLRSCSFEFRIINLETLQFYEFYLRNARDEVIFPYWPAYQTVTQDVSTGTSVNIDTTLANIATTDYVFLIQSDYSRYSIRQISTIFENLVVLDEGPQHATYGDGDFLVPAIVGEYMDRPSLSYSQDRREGRFFFRLLEHQVNGDRQTYNQSLYA